MGRTVKIPDVQELGEIALDTENATVPHTPVSARMDGPAMDATFLTAQEIPIVLTEVKYKYRKPLIIRFRQKFSSIQLTAYCIKLWNQKFKKLF